MNNIKDAILNPFDKYSTLVSYQKKMLVLEQVATIPHLIKNVIFIVIAAFIFNSLALVPATVVTVCASFEIFMAISRIFLSVKTTKAIKGIPDPGNNSGLYMWKLVLTSEYYSGVKSIIGLLGLGGLAIYFGNSSAEFVNKVVELPKTSIPTSFEIPHNVSVLTAIYIYLAIRAIPLLKIIVHYWLIKKIDMTDSLADNERILLLWKSKMDYFTSFPVIFGILGTFYLLGIPPLVLSPFVLFTLVLIYLNYLQIKGLQSSKFDQNSQPTINSPIPNYIGNVLEKNKLDRNSSSAKSIKPEEHIITTVYGVLRVAADLKGIFRVTGGGAYGVGKTIDTENTLIITNHRFLLTEVPVTGGNAIMGETNFTQQNVFFNRAEIKEKGEFMLKNTPLEKLISDAVRNYPFSDIKGIILDKFNLTIEFANGDKYKCHFMDNEYTSMLKDALLQTLKEKVNLKI